MKEQYTRMNLLWECTTGEKITGEKLALTYMSLHRFAGEGETNACHRTNR